MRDIFDIHELTDFEKDLIELAEKTMPRETKSFMRKENNKLKKATKSLANTRVKKKTKNYVKSIKSGKVYKFKGAWAIRTYSGAPHAHLIELGHRQVSKDGRELGFTPGKYVFRDARKQFANTYYNDVQQFIDDLLNKGLG